MEYFNFCDCYFFNIDFSYLRDLSIAVIGTAIGFGGSLWLYYLKNRYDKEKEIKQEHEQLDKLLFYYKELLQTIYKNFNLQIDLAGQYIVQQRAGLTNLKVLKKVASNDFERLRNIDHKGVFEAWTFRFEESDAIKEFNKLNSRLDFLDGTKVELHRLFFYNSNRCVSILDDVKEMIELVADKLHLESRPIKRELGEARWENKYFVFLIESVEKYHSLLDSNAQFDQLNNEFLLPVIERYVNEFPNEGKTDEIVILCKNARVRLNNVKMENKHILIEYRNILKKVVEPLQELKISIEKLNSALEMNLK